MTLSVDADAGGVAVVTLNRPDKRNALSIDLRWALAQVFSQLGADEETGCIVLTGAPPAFSAGMDVTQFGGDAEHKQQLVDCSVAAFEAVRGCAKPVIAAVNGPARAGGFALAMLADMRIAGESADFGFSELPRGIPPAYAALRAIATPEVAADLTLTGRVVDAAEALRLGLVSEVVADAALLDRARAVAAGIAAQPRAATLETKARILRDREMLFGHLFAEEFDQLRRALLP